ncbi:MAG: sugar phosphate nucleotidyltransferase [Clostridium sp.]|nr:sugar phosphate nucleotidyltransferase [Clostridium sp.]
MKDIALVIMAAGIGSRYGAGIKQLQKVGPQGELIIDYSIYDALEAGFTKVIFIIRRDIEDDFKEVIGSRIEKICPVEYVFQDRNDLPEGFDCPAERTKPWGTGQAVLACREVLDVPFVVINADDYYGKEAFAKIYQFLAEHESAEYQYCMAGFKLANTLSENGTVTRGICSMDGNGRMVEITETHEIMRQTNGAYSSEEEIALGDDTLVSMNMWGLTPEFIDILEDKFVEFLKSTQGDLKAEYLLPIIIGDLLEQQKITVWVLPTADRWFGVTYAEDKDSVVKAFKQLVADGVYGEALWSQDR